MPESLDFSLQKLAFPKQPEVVFVLGGPGSGKGTQCELICQGNFGFTHLSAGDLLRQERNRPNSPVGDLINTFIKDGKIVPSHVTIMLLQRRMLEVMETSGGSRFLIDGFPRQMDQALLFEEMVAIPNFILYFSAPDGTLTDRLLNRGKTSNRIDDNHESIQKRLVTFHQTSMQVVNRYFEKGSVKEVDASAEKERVWECVREMFEAFEKN